MKKIILIMTLFSMLGYAFWESSDNKLIASSYSFSYDEVDNMLININDADIIINIVGDNTNKIAIHEETYSQNNSQKTVAYVENRNLIIDEYDEKKNFKLKYNKRITLNIDDKTMINSLKISGENLKININNLNAGSSDLMLTNSSIQIDKSKIGKININNNDGETSFTDSISDEIFIKGSNSHSSFKNHTTKNIDIQTYGANTIVDNLKFENFKIDNKMGHIILDLVSEANYEIVGYTNLLTDEKKNKKYDENTIVRKIDVVSRPIKIVVNYS